MEASRCGSGACARGKRLGMTAVAATVMLFATAPTRAGAFAGDLDATFSADGRLSTDLGPGPSGAAATARQPDGKIVSVGRTNGIGNGVIAVTRHNADGTLDTSFDGDGRATSSVGFEATDVALQADGKIVVVGSGENTGQGFVVVRYKTDGALDSTFSGDGVQTTNFSADSNDAARGLALQDDGKIVVAGGAGGESLGTNGDFALARYNVDGSLDTSFAGDGTQTTDFAASGSFSESANAVALAPGGKIVAAGAGGPNSEGDFALARYNADGSLDTSFSADGKELTDFGGTASSPPESATDVAVQADGKVVAVGPGPGGFVGDFGVARYNDDGSLDTGFSADGKQTVDFGGGFGEIAQALAFQPDGRILVGGSSGQSAGSDFALARLTNGGDLDATFSGDGKAVTDFGSAFDSVGDIVLQPDGRIIAVGDSGDARESRFFGGSSGDFALARYDADGSQDPTFGNTGTVRTSFAGSDDARAAAVQPDGRIVAVGGNATGDFAVTRYNGNGSVDASFGGSGTVVTSFGDAQVANGARGVALQPDGKLVVVGQSRTGEAAVARYNPNGTLDTGFSGDGKQVTDLGVGVNDIANDLALQPDGKILVAGESDAGEFQALRYNADGSPDTSFSGDGQQTIDLGGGDAPTGIALQPNGRIVLAGRSSTDTGSRFAAARLTGAGEPDVTFSGDGQDIVTFADAATAEDVVVQPDGKILLVGAEADFALARYNSDGTLDTTFSGDGKQVTAITANALSSAQGVALQSDGKIVAAGSDGANGGDFAVARYNPDGSLDTGFSGDGRQTTDFAGGSDFASAIAVQSDGLIVVAGTALVGDSFDLALARYEAVGVAPPPPDADGDGVPDSTDACPSVAASTANGCPAPPSPPADSDGDGVVDVVDACPTVAAGTSNGCPSAPPPSPPAAAPSQPPATNLPPSGGREPAQPERSTPAAPSTKVIRARLAKAIAPRGKAAKIGALRKKGRYTASFAAPTAGSARISWYLPKNGKLRLIANGRRTFSAGQAAGVSVRLTKAGKQALKRATRLKIIVRGSFTPKGQRPVSTSRRLALRR